MFPNEALDQVIKFFSINATELAAKSGVDPTELSRFRNAHRDWGSKKLHQVIKQLSPMQKAFYYSLLQSEANIVY